MALAFRAESHVVTTGSTVTITEPTGTVQGDIIVGISLVAGSSATNVIPIGWTSLFSGTSATSQFTYNLCYVVRGSSAVSTAFSHSGSPYYEIHLLSFSGGSTANPIDNSAQATSTSGVNVNPDAPSVTANAANTMAVAFGVNWVGSKAGGWVPPSGYTLVSSNGNNYDTAVATKPLSATGAENPGTFSGVVTTGTADVWAASVTLAPFVAATPVPIAWLAS